jgi:hypothetical protein
MIKNAKSLPVVLYGLHMCEGVAEYADGQENQGQPYRILIGEECLKNMDQTFAGRPLYVQHVDGVNLDKLQEEAAGYVVESFYNPLDGKHWAKFIVVSDAGHEAIRAGWKLSNAYLPKSFSGGGKWHNVDYLKEVMIGEYEHLAIVPNPRYEESIILTPEEFKSYNSEKELELRRLANSKGEKSMSMFNFFKKTKMENASEFETATVVLTTGKEKTIKQLINEAEEKEKEDPMKNLMDSKVKVGEDEMSVCDLVEKYNGAMKELSELKKSASEKAEDKPKEEPKEGEKKNEEDPADKKEKELEKEEEDKEKVKANEKEEDHFEKIKNAPFTVKGGSIDLTEDKVSRGKSRYGSN